jgi:serine/threonine-protein kinase
MGVDPATDTDGAGNASDTDEAKVPAPSADGVPQFSADEVTETPEPLEIGGMVGDYRIERVIGRGGMGHVYGATHPIIGKKVAIKILNPFLSENPDAVERFMLEARAVNQIGHPNIVDIFTFGQLADGRSYMAMEWLRGETLALRRKRPISIEEICHILDSVCAALEAAHEHNIVHRDLKPDNVFLVQVKGSQPMVKLLDFGIAKLIGDDAARSEHTRTGHLLGTPAYLSPEQARGKGVDYRSDLYSLGVMAFELFVGERPFESDVMMDLIVAHLQQAPPRPSQLRPQLPPSVDALLLALLEKDPLRRPSMEVVRRSLAEIRDGATELSSFPRPVLELLPGEVVVPGSIAGRRGAKQRMTWLVAGGVFASGAIATLLFTAAGDREASPPSPAIRGARDLDAGATSASTPAAEPPAKPRENSTVLDASPAMVATPPSIDGSGVDAGVRRPTRSDRPATRPSAGPPPPSSPPSSRGGGDDDEGTINPLGR